MKVITFVIMFLLVGAFFIVSENNLALKDSKNREKFSELYIAWANRIFENSKSLVGYVVKMDWLPVEDGEG